MKGKISFKILVLLAVLIPTKLFAQEPVPAWSEKMAKTVMTIWKDSLYSAPGRPAKWTYDQGVILKGIEGLWYKTGDAKYFNYMQKSMDFLVIISNPVKAADTNIFYCCLITQRNRLIQQLFRVF